MFCSHAGAQGLPAFFCRAPVPLPAQAKPGLLRLFCYRGDYQEARRRSEANSHFSTACLATFSCYSSKIRLSQPSHNPCTSTGPRNTASSCQKSVTIGFSSYPQTVPRLPKTNMCGRVEMSNDASSPTSKTLGQSDSRGSLTAGN